MEESSIDQCQLPAGLRLTGWDRRNVLHLKGIDAGMLLDREDMCSETLILPRKVDTQMESTILPQEGSMGKFRMSFSREFKLRP
jgi:hypothetical protein